MCFFLFLLTTVVNNQRTNSSMDSFPRVWSLTRLTVKKSFSPTTELSSRVLLISFPYLSKSYLCRRPTSATGGTQQSWNVDMGMNNSVQMNSFSPAQNIFIILLWDNIKKTQQVNLTSFAVLTRLGSIFKNIFFGVPLLPEALCLLCEGSWVPSIRWLIQLGQQGLAGLLAWVIRKLDSYGFSGTRRLLTVQALDGLLSLNSPVKTNEANTSGNAWAEWNGWRIIHYEFL